MAGECDHTAACLVCQGWVPPETLEDAIQVLRELAGAGVEMATVVIGAVGEDKAGNLHAYNRWRTADTEARRVMMDHVYPPR
jgi:hypothetical protein